MISTGQILLKYGSGSKFVYELNDSELKDLQKYSLCIYNDIEEYCERHNLRVMMGFGSTLGAFRHKGFIPWDDDIDVIMPKDDYLKFINGFTNDYGDKYFVSSPLVNDCGCSFFGKVIDKKSTFLTIDSAINTHHGVFVDIFPLENIPDSRLLCFIKKYTSMMVMYIGMSVHFAKHSFPAYKQFMTSVPEGKFNYYFRKLIGLFFSFISFRSWARIFNWIVDNKYTGNYHCPYAYYRWKPQPLEMFFPIKKVPFENINANVPNDTEAYLIDTYGSNFMKLPPVEKRLKHYVQKFSLKESVD